MSEEVPHLQDRNININMDKNTSQSPHLRKYNLFSWTPDPTKSFDENYMDIVMFLTRSAQFRQGSMGCIIVKPHAHTMHDHQNINIDSEHINENGINDDLFNHVQFYDSILAASTNQSLFNPKDSDIHAEIATLGECLRQGNSTKGCTVYITMPPCKRCFGALVSAGIGRIVSNQKYHKSIQDSAKVRNIELVSMSREFSDDQRDRINEIIKSATGGNNDHATKISEGRKRRKEEKKRRRVDKQGEEREHFITT
jgi:deoxycytidylate deaminase